MKRFQSLLALDYPLYKRIMLKYLLLLPLFQIVISFFIIINIRRNLYDYDSLLRKNVLSTHFASMPQEIFSSTQVPILLTLSCLAAILLVFYLLNQTYEPSKSIYTLMRLPYSKITLFLAKILPSIFLLIVSWILEGIVTILYLGMYLLAIPSTNRSSGARVLRDFFQDQHVNYYFPIFEPIRVFGTLLILIAIPILSFLLFTTWKNKKYAFLSLPVFIGTVLCIFLFLVSKPFSIWILLTSITLSTLVTVFYFTKIQIV